MSLLSAFHPEDAPAEQQVDGAIVVGAVVDWDAHGAYFGLSAAEITEVQAEVVRTLGAVLTPPPGSVQVPCVLCGGRTRLSPKGQATVYATAGEIWCAACYVMASAARALGMGPLA